MCTSSYSLLHDLLGNKVSMGHLDGNNIHVGFNLQKIPHQIYSYIYIMEELAP